MNEDITIKYAAKKRGIVDRRQAHFAKKGELNTLPTLEARG